MKEIKLRVKDEEIPIRSFEAWIREDKIKTYTGTTIKGHNNDEFSHIY